MKHSHCFKAVSKRGWGGGAGGVFPTWANIKSPTPTPPRPIPFLSDLEKHQRIEERNLLNQWCFTLHRSSLHPSPPRKQKQFDFHRFTFPLPKSVSEMDVLNKLMTIAPGSDLRTCVCHGGVTMRIYVYVQIYICIDTQNGLVWQCVLF